MGNMAYRALALSQQDVEELRMEHCRGRLSQTEVEALFARFRDLDRDHKGYLTQAQLERIPELVINPLASRFLSRFDNVNFKDFCSVLSFFGKSATKEDQIEFIFETFDSDGDGMVSKGDLMQMLQLLTGRFLMETEKEDLVDRALDEARLRGLADEKDGETFLGLKAFHEVLQEPGLTLSL